MEYIVLIGRMQPFHMGHKLLLEEALNKAEKKVIVILGSAFTARNIKNPFTALEREKMILDSLSEDQKKKVSFVFQRDYYYNDNKWLSEVQTAVKIHSHESNSIALIGHDSDESSSYLYNFPQWKFIETGENKYPHATSIRNLLFSNKDYSTYLPVGTIKFLEEFKKTKHFELLKQEFNYITEYKELWAKAPYPPTFVTTDAVVIKSGHVLVVTRKCNPGKGLLALPGGFLNQNEQIQDACIRELKEETKIKINKHILQSSIVKSKVFDYPSRSLRGRTITHGFLIDLGSGDLPEVKGSDDAEKAFWLPISKVNSNESLFFEDHFHIISYFCSC